MRGHQVVCAVMKTYAHEFMMKVFLRITANIVEGLPEDDSVLRG